MGTRTRNRANNINSDGTPTTLNSASVVTHSPETDLQPIKSDLTALAIREATNEASAAFNLPNSFIETFTDDTNLGTETDVDRISGNIVTIDTTPAYDLVMGTWNSQISLNSGSWTGALTNDNVTEGSAPYKGGYVDHLFDLAYDWKIRLFYVNSSGNLISQNYGLYTAVITTDTSATAGQNPSVFESQNTTSYPHTNLTPANVGSHWITSGYNTTTGISSLTDNYAGNGGSLQTLNCSSASQHARGYRGNVGTYGMEVIYTRGSNQITIKFATNSGFTTFTDTAGTTFTNVPSSGRFMFAGGDDSGSNDNISTTYNTADNTNFGYRSAVTTGAAGTLIQSANAVTGTRTTVGGTMLYKDNEGTATLGSANDLAIYFTCDGGSNWTEAASYNAITPVYSTGVKQVRLGETTCTQGTDVRYKAVWANQSGGSKETQLHGIGINY